MVIYETNHFDCRYGPAGIGYTWLEGGAITEPYKETIFVPLAKGLSKEALPTDTRCTWDIEYGKEQQVIRAQIHKLIQTTTKNTG